MNTEDEEFNRIEREAAMRMEAVSATMQKPMHPEITKMFEDYFDKCFRAYSAQREWVGLTRAECLQIEKDMSKYYDYQHECKTVCLPEFAKAIEAKLREKNT